jgi:hypothetical protein
MQKTRISYIDEDCKSRIITISNELLPYYDKWRKTKEEIENGRWNGANREKAYDCMEKCLAKFTYQSSKDEPIKCECGAIINRCVIARHRTTTKHIKQMKVLEEQNPEEPTEIVIEKTDKMCECGQIVSKAHYARHIMSSRHNKYMESK